MFGVRVERILLGGEEVTDVMAGMLPFSLDAGGILGAGILHRFDVTLDYSNRRMILQRNEWFDDPQLENRSGIG